MATTNRRVIQSDESASEEEVYISAEAEHTDEEVAGSDTAWNWSSRSRLVELVHIHGKNWGSLLKKLHDEHLASGITDSDKLRCQFNSINGSKSRFRLPFKKKKFKAPSKNPDTGAKLSKSEKKRLEDEHNVAEEQRKAQHGRVQGWLKTIADEELKAMKGRGKKRTIAEVNGQIDEGEAARQATKQMRIESSLKLAQRQQEKEDLLLKVLGQAVNVLANTNRLIVKLSGDVYRTQPFNPSADANNNNNDCEICDDDE